MEQITHGLGKRAQVYGPLVPKLDGLSCPGDIDVDDIKPCPYCSSETGEDKLATRDGEACWYDPDFTGEPCPSNKESTKHMLDKRSTKKLKWKYKGSTKTLPVVNYPSCGDAVDKDSIKKWYGYEVANVPCNPTIQKLSGQLSRSDFVSKCIIPTTIIEKQR